MKYFVLVLLAAPIMLRAQETLQPCVYGFACINVGGSPDVIPHPDNQLVRIFQGATDRESCDGLIGNYWAACNYVNVHGCRRPASTDRYAALLDAETLRLVAAACGWK
jgi:hypothetical protein